MTAAMTPDDFRSATGVSRETCDRLAVHEALLRRWQGAVNLVGPASLTDPWRRHYLDSAQLAPLIPATARRLVDLGSGAGFPGLILALVTGRTVDLVESDGRKCAFLREAARLTAAPVRIHETRIAAAPVRNADLVTARALAPLDRLCAYGAPILARGGICLFLKGRRVAEELTEAEKRWKMHLTRIPSRSDPDGVILRVGDLCPV